MPVISAFFLFEVMFHHFPHHFFKSIVWLPLQKILRLCGITNEHFNFRWPEIKRINYDKRLFCSGIISYFIHSLTSPFYFNAHMSKRQFNKLPHAVRRSEE